MKKGNVSPIIHVAAIAYGQEPRLQKTAGKLFLGIFLRIDFDSADIDP